MATGSALSAHALRIRGRSLIRKRQYATYALHE
jgi:hypothetical protein